MTESRVQKSILNARVSIIFYLLTLALSFFSRRIFLENLGAEFLGLTTTIGNLLSFLNLAELGISTAVGYILYKPVFDNNHHKINEIISVLAYLYKRIGQFMIAGGIILSLFLPLIFQKADFQPLVIYVVYYVYLFAAALGYFINYKQILLISDQRFHIITTYTQMAGILKVALQMYLAYQYHSFYAWIIVEFVFSIAIYVALNRKIKEIYPWLETNVKKGIALLKEYSSIGKSIKQLSVHKIADFVLYSTKDLFIYHFASLTMVAYYGNYMVIVLKANQLIQSALGGMLPGIGNLIAENNKKKIMKVFWEIIALRYLASAIFIYALFHLLQPFIVLWLGAQYQLPNSIFYLILANVFVMQVRNVVLNFIQGYGLYGDIFAPVTEASLNISLSILLGYLMGMEGVLYGSLISMLVIGYFWKPFFLFRRGFRLPIASYWKELGKYLLLIAITWALTNSIINQTVFINPYHSFISLIIYGFVVVTGYSIILGTAMCFFLKGAKDLLKRLNIQKLIKPDSKAEKQSITVR